MVDSEFGAEVLDEFGDGLYSGAELGPVSTRPSAAGFLPGLSSVRLAGTADRNRPHRSRVRLMPRGGVGVSAGSLDGDDASGAAVSAGFRG